MNEDMSQIPAATSEETPDIERAVLSLFMLKEAERLGDS